ncbi:MAG TPA: hypothetical protein VFZ73_03610 [Gemmatimonadaceae bacterium]
MAVPSQVPDAARTEFVERLRGWVLFAGAAILAFLLYRPDTNAPFEIVDFSETLPYLTEARTFSDRFHGLVGYYLAHGRAAFVLSAGLAARWTAFGWWMPGWQWVGYLIGLVVVVLCWHLLRALGANRLGAAVGASLFIVAEAVAPGWLKPQVNESLGTILLLAASLLACRFQGAPRPYALAVSIGALLFGLILVKETLVATAFFPVVIALARDADGSFHRPTPTARNAVLAVSCTTAILLAALPIVWALTQASADGYVRQFGSGDSVLSNALFGVLPAVIPFTPVTPPPTWATTLADVAWVAILAAAFGPLTEGAAGRNRTVLWLALMFPIARLLVYLPWPLQFPYYSIPFLVGAAVLSSIGVTRLTSARPSGLRLAIGAVAIVMVYASLNAHAQAQRHFALRYLTDDLVSELHRVSRDRGIGHIVIAVPQRKSQSWTGLGPTLSRYASATGRTLPDVREITCGEVPGMLAANGGLILAAFKHHCAIPVGSGPVRRVRRFDLSRLREATDTLSASVSVISP